MRLPQLAGKKDALVLGLFALACSLVRACDPFSYCCSHHCKPTDVFEWLLAVAHKAIHAGPESVSGVDPSSEQDASTVAAIFFFLLPLLVHDTRQSAGLIFCVDSAADRRPAPSRPIILVVAIWIFFPTTRPVNEPVAARRRRNTSHYTTTHVQR